MKKLTIQPKVLGMVSTNCYILKNEETNEILIIDPADCADVISDVITRMHGTPKAVLLTHGHFDHSMVTEELCRNYKIKSYAQEQERDLLEDANLNLSASHQAPFTVKVDEFLKDNQELTLAGFPIRVLHTPGHTAGSCCYYFEEEGVLFSGDTLFLESVGRTDFPTSSGGQMQQSLNRLLATLPEETLVYPGHMEMTSIEHEKRYNPFA